MDPWFLTAAGLTLTTALIHLFAGGSEVARPLLASTDMGTVPRLTAYYCWHVTTLVLLVMAGGFAFVGFHPVETSLAVALTGLAAAFAALSLIMIATQRVGLLALPQWILFTAIFVPALLGLLS